MKSGMEIVSDKGLKLVLDKKPRNEDGEYVLCALIEEPSKQFCIYERNLDAPYDLTSGRRYENLAEAFIAFSNTKN